jgi:hypothetical protein
MIDRPDGLRTRVETREEHAGLFNTGWIGRNLVSIPKIEATISTAPPVSEPAADLNDRMRAIAAYKAECKAAGIKVTDLMIAQAANRKWTERSRVTWWKAGKDRPGDDALIRKVLRAKPHLHLPPP